MEIKNNKEEVPFQHYLQEFEQMDPEDAVRRLGLPFDGGAFTIGLLNQTYTIAWPKYAIQCGDPDAYALKKLPAQTFLLRYLLMGKQLPAAGGWKTFRQLPWGEVYLQPFNGRCIRRSAVTFGKNLDKFAQASRALGGTEIAQGDRGFEFAVVQDYRTLRCSLALRSLSSAALSTVLPICTIFPLRVCGAPEPLAMCLS